MRYWHFCKSSPTIGGISGISSVSTKYNFECFIDWTLSGDLKYAVARVKCVTWLTYMSPFYEKDIKRFTHPYTDIMYAGKEKPNCLPLPCNGHDDNYHDYHDEKKKGKPTAPALPYSMWMMPTAKDLYDDNPETLPKLNLPLSPEEEKRSLEKSKKLREFKESQDVKNVKNAKDMEHMVHMVHCQSSTDSKVESTILKFLNPTFTIQDEIHSQSVNEIFDLESKFNPSNSTNSSSLSNWWIVFGFSTRFTLTAAEAAATTGTSEGLDGSNLSYFPCLATIVDKLRKMILAQCDLFLLGIEGIVSCVHKPRVKVINSYTPLAELEKLESLEFADTVFIWDQLRDAELREYKIKGGLLKEFCYQSEVGQSNWLNLISVMKKKEKKKALLTWYRERLNVYHELSVVDKLTETEVRMMLEAKSNIEFITAEIEKIEDEKLKCDENKKEFDEWMEFYVREDKRLLALKLFSPELESRLNMQKKLREMLQMRAKRIFYSNVCLQVFDKFKKDSIVDIVDITNITTSDSVTGVVDTLDKSDKEKFFHFEKVYT